MKNNMFQVASCDSQGSVYIARNAVYRSVEPLHEKNVLSTLAAVQENNIEGLVQTVICEDKAECSEMLQSGLGLVLKHKKIRYISYPHEWCASMLQDAASFHLELTCRLFEKNLFLKDAHPWNILFDKGRPVFVDFASVVSREVLFEEKYLEANVHIKGESTENRLLRVTEEIFKRMYLPYFVNPLYMYAFGERDQVGKTIESTTLNASTSIITFRNCFPRRRWGKSSIKKLLGLLKSCWSIRRIFARLRERSNLLTFYRELSKFVEALDVAVGGSAYSTYYKQKGEDQVWVYSNDWNAKQKAVYKALNVPGVYSVLDVACNTGWFALMAEKMGKSVVAFDIDEGCIEALYEQVKKDRLDILPLVINFTALTKDRYSIYDGKKVLLNAKQRLRSDSVIALGIVHHLVLGLGMSFEEVVEQLISLCEKQLVIEFVAADDAMIQNEPSFFPAYFQNKELLTGYKVNKLITLIEKEGYEVEIEQSHPETRNILICNKRPDA